MRIKPAHSSRHTLASYIIITSLVILALAGVLSPYSYNILPATAILEGALFFAALTTIKGTNKDNARVLVAAAIYVTSSLAIMALLKPANIWDFVQGYKSFFYIIPLSLFISKSKFKQSELHFILYTLLALFLLKYGYSKILHLDTRLADRPGLYTENNFELILLILIYYLSSSTLGKHSKTCFLILAFIVVISGSRSSLLALLIVYAAVFITKLDYKFLFSLVALLILGGIAGYVFLERLGGGSIEDIDRYKFAQIFLTEIQNWNIANYLFGNLPLTPLSSSSCAALSFYHSLYSYSGDGSCYSVILHSYLLRAILDQGILGLASVILFVNYGLKRSGYSTRQRLCFIGIFITSGLSVSSLNSVYSAISLAIAFSYPQRERVA